MEETKLQRHTTQEIKIVVFYSTMFRLSRRRQMTRYELNIIKHFLNSTCCQFLRIYRLNFINYQRMYAFNWKLVVKISSCVVHFLINCTGPQQTPSICRVSSKLHPESPSTSIYPGNLLTVMFYVMSGNWNPHSLLSHQLTSPRPMRSKWVTRTHRIDGLSFGTKEKCPRRIEKHVPYDKNFIIIKTYPGMYNIYTAVLIDHAVYRTCFRFPIGVILTSLTN